MQGNGEEEDGNTDYAGLSLVHCTCVLNYHAVPHKYIQLCISFKVFTGVYALGFSVGDQGS